MIAAVQRRDKLDDAAEVLARATAEGHVDAAVLYVRHRESTFARSFGTARSTDDLFLMGSISKTMTAAALMTLFDRGRFRLDDPVRKFIPEFTGAARDRITIRQLLTHVSGLPDQLPENAALRRRHAPLSEFVAGAVKTPLLFEPGSRYGYSSMAILLAAEVARRISGTEFSAFIDEPSSGRWRWSIPPWDSGGSRSRPRCGARPRAPRRNPGRGTPRPGSGIGTAPTGAGWGRRGAACTPPPPTWRGSSPSSSIGRAGPSGRRPRG